MRNDYWWKRAMHYWTSWKRHYGVNPDDIVTINRNMLWAIRRALKQAHSDGMKSQRIFDKRAVDAAIEDGDG